MSLTAWTIIIMFSCVAILVLWDIFVIIRDKSGKSTISYIIATASRKRPIIAFAIGLVVGVLAGHFWPIISLTEAMVEVVK